jgi:integrase
LRLAHAAIVVSSIRKIEEHFRIWILPALGASTPISAITAAELRELRYDLGASDLEYRSVNRILTSLRQVFKFAEHERGYCSAPSLPLNYPEGSVDDKWTLLTAAEVAVVIAATPAVVEPFFTFVGNTGLRVGTALATETNWIDFDQRTVRYPASVMKNRDSP